MAELLRPITEVKVGEALHRVHTADRDACFYGNRDGTWRWDDPTRGYGVLYVGLTQEGPFAETLLRLPGERALLWSNVERRRWALFRVTETLQLADMHGRGLGFEGVSVTAVSGDHDGTTYPGAYEKAQEISAKVHATTNLDGIAYRSRLNPDQICVAVFERAGHKIELVEQGKGIDRDWVENLLQRHGKHVVDV